jgi:hypothetical protein
VDSLYTRETRLNNRIEGRLYSVAFHHHRHETKPKDQQPIAKNLYCHLALLAFSHP